VSDAEVIQKGGNPERPSEQAMRLVAERRQAAGTRPLSHGDAYLLERVRDRGCDLALYRRQSAGIKADYDKLVKRALLGWTNDRLVLTAAGLELLEAQEKWQLAAVGG
jgi:hypothetical protein